MSGAKVAKDLRGPSKIFGSCQNDTDSSSGLMLLIEKTAMPRSESQALAKHFITQVTKDHHHSTTLVASFSRIGMTYPLDMTLGTQLVLDFNCSTRPLHGFQDLSCSTNTFPFTTKSAFRRQVHQEELSEYLVTGA